MQFEYHYANLIDDILKNGEPRNTRNGLTLSTFGKTLEIDMSDSNYFPLLYGRKMYPKGILGEFAAFVRGPKHIKDFEKWGCNYWKLWAKESGDINVDYGNLWLDFNGINQLEEVIAKLKLNPTDRRILISSWKPDNLATLDLPCCHLLYQWYVRDGQYLDMMWYQRSADVMIGIPSDIVLAALFNTTLANEVCLKPGKITMVFGDTHIYTEHQVPAKVYVHRVRTSDRHYPTYVNYNMKVTDFLPENVLISGYKPLPELTLKLKA